MNKDYKKYNYTRGVILDNLMDKVGQDKDLIALLDNYESELEKRRRAVAEADVKLSALQDTIDLIFNHLDFEDQVKVNEKLKPFGIYHAYTNDPTVKVKVIDKLIDGGVKELEPIYDHTTIKCLKCNEEITGDGNGTYITCPCKSLAIDETPYYTRIIGNEEDYEIITGRD